MKNITSCYILLFLTVCVPVWGSEALQPASAVVGQAVDKAVASGDAARSEAASTVVAPAASDPKTAVPRLVAAGKKPPVSGINYGEPYLSNPDGVVYVSARSTFSIKALGGVDGVAKTEYRLDEGQWKAYEPFTIAAAGPHLIEYRSTDNAGNVEKVRSLSVMVDTAPPLTAIYVDKLKIAPGTPAFISNNSTVTLAADDNLAGVEAVEYRLDQGSWRSYAPFTVSASGGHTIGFRSRDKLGNVEEEKTITVGSDKIAPKTVITVGEPRYTAANGTLYISDRTRLTLAVSESIAGVLRSEYRIDGGPWTVYAPFTIDREGPHDISYRSVGRGGVVEEARMLSLIVDMTPPQSEIVVGLPKREADGVTYINRTTILTPKAADNLAGVDKIEYFIAGKEDGSDSVPFTIQTDDKYRLDYQGIDKVGNREPLKTMIIVVDSTLPVVNTPDGKPLDAGGMARHDFRFADKTVTDAPVPAESPFFAAAAAARLAGSSAAEPVAAGVADGSLVKSSQAASEPAEKARGVDVLLLPIDTPVPGKRPTADGDKIAQAPAVRPAAGLGGAEPLRPPDPTRYMNSAPAAKDTTSIYEYITMGVINIALIIGVMLL